VVEKAVTKVMVTSVLTGFLMNGTQGGVEKERGRGGSIYLGVGDPLLNREA
jgi:hypothetical protein